MLGLAALTTVDGARADTNESAAAPPPPATALASLDAQARWLAGLSPLPSLEASADWKAYAQAENDRWVHAKPRVTLMQDWSTRTLGSMLPPAADLTVFYPFAGPDALHALALFGNAKRIVLVGLEPVGALPNPAKAPSGFFSRLGNALGDVHRLTFFRTREMSTDFQREGVVSAIVATIPRVNSNARVTNVQVQAKSARIDIAIGPNATTATTATTTTTTQRIDYIQADLANFGLTQSPQLAIDLHAMAPYVSFVKAAMYLLAEPRFSTLRQAMLDDSTVIVQDDTGIPYRHFTDERWAKRLFGKYEKPVTPFEERYQPNLQTAYESKSITPLPFGVGYHVQPNRSNLLVASKASVK